AEQQPHGEHGRGDEERAGKADGADRVGAEPPDDERVHDLHRDPAQLRDDDGEGEREHRTQFLRQGRYSMVVIPIVVVAALLAQQPETVSLLNEPLYAPSLPKAERAKAEETLATTSTAYRKAPNDPAVILAYAEAVLAFGHVGDALEI